MQTNDWKDTLEQLYGLMPEVPAESANTEPDIPVPAVGRQILRIELDKRNGKPATLITGFNGTGEALKQLAKQLKTTCGTGGAARGGEILIQGDMRVKVAEILTGMGHKVRKINF